MTSTPGNTTPPTVPLANPSLPSSEPTTSTAIATLAPSKTPIPVTSSPTMAIYLDDRSTPSQLIRSYYNAVNRQEYLRAYNYWINPSTSQGNFTSFANGYKDTASVDLVFGQITGDAGAGQLYFTVPVILDTTTRNGVRGKWAACYVVHQAQPVNFGEPPFDPMGIDRGTAKPSDINASDASLLATTCDDFPTGSSEMAISAGSLNIDKNNFLDNRSGPIETVSSFLNALNLKQYVRAYYYFQEPATFPGPFDKYAAGYSDTDVITAAFGAIQTEGAAGSLYYKVPLVMHVLTNSNTTQTFAGCYTLRLVQPSVQATPPFQPMGIIAGNFKQVANGANITTLLPAACN